MIELSTDELDGIESVTSGHRARARWRTEQGWVRLERLTDRTVVVSGPPVAVRRIWHACRGEWHCAGSRAGGPVHYIGHRGNAELMLVQSTPSP